MPALSPASSPLRQVNISENLMGEVQESDWDMLAGSDVKELSDDDNRVREPLAPASDSPPHSLHADFEAISPDPITLLSEDEGLALVAGHDVSREASPNYTGDDDELSVLGSQFEGPVIQRDEQRASASANVTSNTTYIMIGLALLFLAYITE